MTKAIKIIMVENRVEKIAARQILIAKDHAGRRIDNYLIGYFQRMPKSRVYQMLRKGEVRVNKARIKPTYRLKTADRVRLPPVYQQPPQPVLNAASQQLLLQAILYEDDGLMIINKPAGMLVHAATAPGIIETLRNSAPEYQTLELVHRLDKASSGCLLLAKTLPVLRQLQALFKHQKIYKEYTTLLAGRVSRRRWVVEQPLLKSKPTSKCQRMRIAAAGKAAKTIFLRERLFTEATLVRVQLLTGRTHQIRVHSAAILKHPILGDNKYGDKTCNTKARQLGLQRMFLHASRLQFISPITHQQLLIKAPLPPSLLAVLAKMQVTADG